MSKLKILLAAFALVALPMPAFAQTDDTGTGTTTTDTGDAETGEQNTLEDAEETNDFPWGLLGLLGLAGLAGLRRNDRREVHLGGPTDGPRR